MSSDVAVDRVLSDAVLQPPYAAAAATTTSSNTMDVVVEDDDTNDWFLINTKNVCRACRSIKSIRIDWSQGDRICTACGVVQEERILDMNPEWRDYGDNDDRCNGTDDLRFGSYRARSGMIPNNETKYIGGLQPTTLSRSAYNGTNGVRKQGSSAITSSNIAQRLRKVHRKIEHRMEQQNKVAMKNASLNLQLLRKRQRQDLERREATATATTTDADTENTDTVTATVNDDDYDNDDLPDYGSNFEWMEERVCTKSDYENLVQEQERYVIQQRQALYANKWSLDRAKLLFVDRHPTSGNSTDHHEHNVEEIENDSVLYAAAQDLFAAYTMICNACTTLQLPITIIDESAALLSQYASRRDGLKVKGIASWTTNVSTATCTTNHSKYHALMTGKRWGRPNHNNAAPLRHNTKAKTTLELEEERQVIKQLNKVRQMASLCAGIVFWIARYRNKPRTILAVCESIVYNNNEKVSKKHCSRALQELRSCFPELVRLSLNPTTPIAISNHISTTTSLASHLRRQTSPVPEAICVQQNHDVSNINIDMSAVESIVNIIEHVLLKLHLPPVAEASVRYLVLYQYLLPFESNAPQQQHPAVLAKTIPVRCAAFTYMISAVGHTMQQLAKQAQQQTHNTNQSNNKKRFPMTSYSDMETKKMKPTKPGSGDNDDPMSDPMSGDLMSFDLFADESPTNPTLDTVNTEQQQSTALPSSSLSSSIVLAEHRAYEMRRMWDAWVEQVPWDRSLTQIEQSTKVTRKNVIEYYKQHIYPHRFVMLESLRDSLKDNDVLSTSNSMFLAHEGSILKKTPLSSVLLSNILVAAPLLKNDIKI